MTGRMTVAPYAVHLPVDRDQAGAALLTLAHLLDADPGEAGPPVLVSSSMPADRCLRDALGPFGGRVRLVPEIPANRPVADPTLRLRPGVIPPTDLLEALAGPEPWARGVRALWCQPVSPSNPVAEIPGLFGVSLRPVSLADLSRTVPGSRPVGGLLLPSGTIPPADWGAVRPAAGLGLAGTPAPAGGRSMGPGYHDLADLHAECLAVIVGNGPSLVTTDLTHFSDAVIFAFNGAWRLRATGRLIPTWHVVEDRLVAEAEAATLCALGDAGLIVPRDHADLIPPGPGRLHAPVDWSWYRENAPAARPGFATTVHDPLYAGQSVAYLALQLAFVMGCDPVIMVGMDLDYRVPPSARVAGRVVTSTADDPNHFDADYFGPGRRWHLPKTDRMLIAFRHAARVYATHGRRLFNATPGGRLSGVRRTRDYWSSGERPEKWRETP